MQLSPNGYVIEGPETLVTDLVGSLYDEGPSYRVYRGQGASTWLMLYTLDGSGVIRNPKSEVHTRAGQVHLLEPGLEHEYFTSPSAKRWAFAWIHFWPRPHWRPLLEWRHIEGGLRELPVVVEKPADSSELALWRTMLAKAGDRRWLAQLEAMATLELIFISMARRVGPGLGPSADARVDQALRYITANLGKPIGVKAIAAACGLSASRLTELFRQTTGISPRDYLERERVFRARHLLASTRLPVREVAMKSGFSSEFYFSSRFKKLSGRSPTAYRQERQGLAGPPEDPAAFPNETREGQPQSNPL